MLYMLYRHHHILCVNASECLYRDGYLDTHITHNLTELKTKCKEKTLAQKYEIRMISKKLKRSFLPVRKVRE